ncbi:hypothetical protein C6A85_14675, partial [Mycobacterium sp. ITM-2017-0098]
RCHQQVQVDESPAEFVDEDPVGLIGLRIGVGKATRRQHGAHGSCRHRPVGGRAACHRACRASALTDRERRSCRLRSGEQGR